MEIWKDIDGYKGLYMVSSRGRIKRLSRIIIGRTGKRLTLKEKILSGSINFYGYRRFELTKDFECQGFSGHRLVALNFIPNPDNLPQINHKNGIKSDNRVRNLEWCDNSENQLHAYRTGLRIPVIRRGENAPYVKLREVQVKNILKAIKNGGRVFELAIKYNVSQSTISAIKKGIRWNHLQTGN